MQEFPKNVSPMLATLADAPFKLDGWFFEPELDGVRAIAYIRSDKCHLSSRRGIDLNGNYPVVVRSLSGYDGDFVFDGEVVALDAQGRSSFQKLQQSSGGLRSFPGTASGDSNSVIVCYVCDILYAQGQDLTGLTVLERKSILQSVLKINDTVRVVKSLGRDGPAVFKACVRPFKKRPPGKLNPTWVKPALLAEVKFMERTRDNILRAPVYIHLREDVEPDEVKEPNVVHIDVKSQENNVAGKNG